MDGPMEDMF